MDKLRLFTPQNALPRHTRDLFECTGKDFIQGSGLQIFYYVDRETGVHLTDTPKGLSLEFNPTKYMHGHNYRQINRVGLVEAVEAIQDRYQPSTEFEQWQVSGVDYNSDIEVEHPPESYFIELGKCKTWRVRETDKTGISYKTRSNSKTYTFYNNLVRCKKDGTPIPPEDEGKYIIRPEMGLNKGLSNIKELKAMSTLQDYIQPDNYRKLPELWLKTYEQIEKNEPVEHIPGLTRSERDMLAAIQLYTLNGYRERLRIEYPNKMHYYHLRKVEELMQKVRAHRKLNTLTRVEELNLKVRQRAQELIEAA